MNLSSQEPRLEEERAHCFVQSLGVPWASRSLCSQHPDMACAGGLAPCHAPCPAHPPTSSRILQDRAPGTHVTCFLGTPGLSGVLRVFHSVRTSLLQVGGSLRPDEGPTPCQHLHTCPASVTRVKSTGVAGGRREVRPRRAPQMLSGRVDPGTGGHEPYSGVGRVPISTSAWRRPAQFCSLTPRRDHRNKTGTQLVLWPFLGHSKEGSPFS